MTTGVWRRTVAQYMWTVYVGDKLYDLATDSEIAVLLQAFERDFLGSVYVMYETGVVQIEI